MCLETASWMCCSVRWNKLKYSNGVFCCRSNLHPWMHRERGSLRAIGGLESYLPRAQWPPLPLVCGDVLTCCSWQPDGLRVDVRKACLPVLAVVVRETHEGQPKIFDAANLPNEVVHVDGLSQVTI